MRAVFVLAAFAALLAATAPAASAAKSCGRQVIDDWYDNGRVDGTYKLHCYDDAIESVPPDVRDYSSAIEDIQRALQNRLRNQPAPPARTDPSPNGTGPVDTTPTTSTSTSTTSTTGGGDPPSGPNGPEVSPPVASGDSASSVPVPLLILAGLALLLVAGGSAGYVIRRFQSRRLPPPAV
jgi:hypothetical protein